MTKGVSQVASLVQRAPAYRGGDLDHIEVETVASPPGGPLWPEHWAVQADLEADRIEHRLSVATARTLTPAEREAKRAVQNHVAKARAACRPKGRRRHRGVRDQWRGTSVGRAYLHLHAAKIFLMDVLPDGEFEALLPDVTTKLGMVLDRNDPRRVEGERLLQASTGLARRAAAKQVMETAYDASDEEYTRLRDFRNIIVLAAFAITALTALLIYLVTQQPQAIPLCFEPAVTVADAPTAGQLAQGVCPSGGRQSPSGGDVLILAGLGALGGVLGALLAIRRLRGTSTPYSVSSALAILKVPSGALSSIIGMLLLAGGFVPGLTNLDSQRQILAYALLFGLAQHLVTRVADNRAQQLLDNLPSKDSDAKPAQPPVVAPPSPGPQAVEVTEVVEETPADALPVPDATVPAMPPAAPMPDEVEANEVQSPADSAGTVVVPVVVEDDDEDADPDDGELDEDGDGADLDEPAPAPVQATDEFLAREEVEALTGQEFPLVPEQPDGFPDDEGEPEVDEEEAAQTGTDKG
jgi:hypothetical protein